MRRRRSRYADGATPAQYVLVLSALAFVVHLIWESVQCRIFFEHGSYPTGWDAMMLAALGDVGLTWMIYLGVAAAWRDISWGRRRWSAGQWAAMLGLAIVLAIGIEVRALATGRWRYTEITPLLPGTGVSTVPVMQLVLLTSLVLWLARWLCRPAEPIDASPRSDESSALGQSLP